MLRRDHTWPGLNPSDYIPEKNEIVGTVNKCIYREGIIKVNHVSSSLHDDNYKIQSVTWYCKNSFQLTWEWVWISNLQQWALTCIINIPGDTGLIIVDQMYAYDHNDVIECVSYASQVAILYMA